MKIELDNPPGSSSDNNQDLYYRIDSYTQGLITINGKAYTSSLIVSPQKLISNWPPKTFSNLALQHITQIIALDPEIIILGTGQHILFPAQDLIVPLLELNIGLETMDTGAACRCYNVLLNEGRKVAAALLPIGDR